MALEPDVRTWRAEKVSHSYVADYKPFAFVDGEGVRCSLYVAGCLFKCVGCYNEAAWSFRYGKPYSRDLEDRVMADLAHPAVQGLSLLGGEPFLNTQVALSAVRRLREEFGDERDVWCWTGYTVERLMIDTEDKRELLGLIDVLVDGTYEEEQRDLSLAFRGSRNQRVLDACATVAAGHAVAWGQG
ncbi:anaerobic ribonucleoside-triphosphate reductase activating protein [Demequina litorisediminis]|uniref:Anaerobic ribonucleoside-triphosphate reductase-activating protein n=1 Tax=Demequina litorisediminis TaxID=1849022 RepID=A0ABQ6IE40_9MICO|nr:anaerobic ribonucleoside-triphosphate reductase activating protein [Demequina litorisediminis]GMA36132.1 anaerobic ribonucleoside-triphosphate reductase-activating protein [Demequina litorisediminis]